MKKLPAVVVLVMVAAAFGVSLHFILQLVRFTSPWVGLMLMFDFLGLVFVARPLFVLRMPRFLRDVRAWESKGAIYKALRVPAFGVLLRRTPLRYLNPMVYLSRHPDPSFVLAQLESAEAAHLWASVVITPHIVFAFVQGWWSAVAWLMVFQIGFNLYPILHLRWARNRLSRIYERMHPHAAR